MPPSSCSLSVTTLRCGQRVRSHWATREGAGNSSRDETCYFTCNHRFLLPIFNAFTTAVTACTSTTRTTHTRDCRSPRARLITDSCGKQAASAARWRGAHLVESRSWNNGSAKINRSTMRSVSHGSSQHTTRSLQSWRGGARCERRFVLVAAAVGSQQWLRSEKNANTSPLWS